MARFSRYNTLLASEKGRGLLYNARTGALARLSADRMQHLAEPEGIEGDFLEFLLHQGFVVGDDVDELALIAASHEAARDSRAGFSATIVLTDACNFRCVYCYQSHDPGHLEGEAEQRIVSYLDRKMDEVEHVHLNWFGGEPLMRLPTIKRLGERVRECADAKGRTTSQFITTNGSLMTPTVARELVACGVESAQITLDGDEVSHGKTRLNVVGKNTYKKVLDACKNTIDAGMGLTVRVNVNSWTAGRIPNLLHDLKARGIDGTNAVIHVVRAINHGNCDDRKLPIFLTNYQFSQEWISILKTIQEEGFSVPNLSPRAYNCSFDLQQTVMFGTDGNIYHCSSSDGMLATVDTDGREANVTPLKARIKSRRPLDDEECRGCRYLPLCMGGCSYLGEKGEEKCNPERYVLPGLIRLTAQQAGLALDNTQEKGS